MTVNYSITNIDNKEHLYFSATEEEIEITIPNNNGSIQQNFSVMISLVEGISLTLVKDTDVELLVDQNIITRPNDLFYLININGLNKWKAIRAGNFSLTSSNREIINEPLELDAGAPIYQFIGASGKVQDIILPNPPAKNDRYIIKNIFKDSFDLNLKESLGGPVILTIGPSNGKYIVECIYDGTEWQLIWM